MIITLAVKPVNLKNPASRYVGQRSVLKVPVHITILTNHSPTPGSSFLISQNKIKVTPKQQVKQNHSQWEGFLSFPVSQNLKKVKKHNQSAAMLLVHLVGA